MRSERGQVLDPNKPYPYAKQLQEANDAASAAVAPPVAAAGTKKNRWDMVHAPTEKKPKSARAEYADISRDQLRVSGVVFWITECAVDRAGSLVYNGCTTC